MPRMMLTDEEASVVLKFRQDNAVRNAFNEGLQTAINVVREAQREQTADSHTDKILSQVCGSITARRR